MTKLFGESLVKTITDRQRRITARHGMTFVDEISSDTPDAFAYAVQAQQAQSRLHRPPPPRTLTAIDVPCARCGKPAGEQCVMWSQRRSRQIYKPHKIRVRDAQLATEAVRALKPL